MSEIDRLYFIENRRIGADPFVRTARRLHADITWIAAGSWQLLGDMYGGRHVQDKLQQAVWNVQEFALNISEKRQIRRELNQQLRAIEKFKLLVLTNPPIDALTVAIQREEFSGIPQETKDAVLERIALRNIYQGVQGQERFFSEAILRRNQVRE